MPAHGVDEDPATGSAAGPLALHLARHGRIAFGEEIEISQGVEIGRPSTLYAVAQSPETRSRSAARAVIVARGEFRLLRRIAVIGPSGEREDVLLSSRLAESLGVRHVEIDAL